MVSTKRKVPQEDSEDSEAYSEVAAAASDDDEVDISHALMGRLPKRPKPLQPNDGSESDDEAFIKNHQSKSNVKGGMVVAKGVKGKGKVDKGTFGGGSFQSMGRLFLLTLSCNEIQFLNNRFTPFTATCPINTRL